MRVEVAYALPDVQHVIGLTLAEGATVADALLRVENEPGFAGLDFARMRIGVYGTVVRDRNQRLEEGDRVEVYRPLTVDPMTARRLRANRKAV
jgi:putative ubiquitin-RnfH superfamily antitoxin RatB of RatAB toxin-antitoxin module